jgi:hypothetical protein
MAWPSDMAAHHWAQLGAGATRLVPGPAGRTLSAGSPRESYSGGCRERLGSYGILLRWRRVIFGMLGLRPLRGMG